MPPVGSNPGDIRTRFPRLVEAATRIVRAARPDGPVSQPSVPTATRVPPVGSPAPAGEPAAPAPAPPPSAAPRRIVSTRAPRRIASFLFNSPVLLGSADEVPAAIVDALGSFLEPVTGVPEPGVVVVNLTAKPLALGGLRGLERIGPFDAMELRGGHIDAVVRFQIWGEEFEAANEQMLALQGRLLAATDDLYDAGFLEMEGVAGTLAVEEGGAWNRTADYRILFEYHLAPASGADSLIARIPIRADQEHEGSLSGETTTVTDDLVRWDQLQAPPLVIRGGRRGGAAVERLAAASFLLPDRPAGAVRLVRTSDEATDPPSVHPDLATFLAAVADLASPAHNAELTFASIDDFLAAFTPSATPFPLGDWDEDAVTDLYQVAELELSPPVPLATARDRFEISLETTPFDQVAVVYLGAAGTFA